MYENIILIPYRNRKEHLDYFLEKSLPLIKNNLSNTKLVIIEQEEGKLFNRGKILNVGFKEYLNKTEYFITHDVDVNPKIQALDLYKLQKKTNHIVGIYSSPCSTLGGIMKIQSETIKNINGFPNYYWGWGVEDKTLYNRAKYYNCNISYNIFSNSNNVKDFFYVFNDINDRKKDNLFSNKTIFEYNIFQKLPIDKQLQHIMSSGLNNLEYTILERKHIQENVEWIKVSI
jgi:hypothetical protein